MSATDLITRLRDRAPWLLSPELGTCVVGSAALAEACRRAGIEGPSTNDLDLAWSLDPDAGRALLEEHGVFQETTTANVERGTLALRLDGQRIEITSLRAPPGPLRERILQDLDSRDMTIGAIAWWLDEDELLDPHGGVEAWRAGQVVAVGDPMDRVREHPIRWIRYFRKAHVLGFHAEPRLRRLLPNPEVLDRILPEALAAEFRSALLETASPGRFFLELFEVGVLELIAPELAAQFDGRPAGPGRHHPEVSQSLHLILALEWAVQRTARLPEIDRLTVLVAVLCHDLGKNLTPAEELPSHVGHEHSGLPVVRAFLARLPSLADKSVTRFAEQVCELHLTARRLREMRPGKLAKWYETYLRPDGFRADLFALAVGADSGGRLGQAADGDRIAVEIEADIAKIREACGTVDAKALRDEFPDDIEAFRAALHEARARAIRRAFSTSS